MGHRVPQWCHDSYSNRDSDIDVIYVVYYIQPRLQSLVECTLQLTTGGSLSCLLEQVIYSRPVHTDPSDTVVVIVTPPCLLLVTECPEKGCLAGTGASNYREHGSDPERPMHQCDRHGGSNTCPLGPQRQARHQRDVPGTKPQVPGPSVLGRGPGTLVLAVGGDLHREQGHDQEGQVRSGCE